MNTCRFCGGKTDLLVPLYAGEGVELELDTKIARHLPVHLSPDDGLPQAVCYPCVDLLLQWDGFVTSCVDMDSKMRSALSNENYCEPPAAMKEDSFSESDYEPLLPVAKRLKTEAAAATDFRLDEFGAKDKTNRDEAKASSKNKCHICGKCYKDKKYLAKHLPNCGRKEDLTCKECNLSYKSRTNLQRHMDREHRNNQELCPVCRISMCSSKLPGHLKTVHAIKTARDVKFKCKLCDEYFTNKFVKNAHFREVHVHVKVKCEFCEFEGYQNVVKRHTRTVHSTKQYPCTKCPAVCKTSHLLKAHMTAHSDLRSFICDICGMGFKRLNNVRDHMKCHQQRCNQCQICGKFFARKRYLAIHEKTIHNLYPDGTPPEQKGFDCGVCGAKLKWKKNLLAHMRIHTGERPYHCKLCKKDFSCHGTLRTHMTKHAVVPADVVLLQHDPLILEIGVFGP